MAKSNGRMVQMSSVHYKCNYECKHTDKKRPSVNMDSSKITVLYRIIRNNIHIYLINTYMTGQMK